MKIGIGGLILIALVAFSMVAYQSTTSSAAPSGMQKRATLANLAADSASGSSVQTVTPSPTQPSPTQPSASPSPTGTQTQSIPSPSPTSSSTATTTPNPTATNTPATSTPSPSPSPTITTTPTSTPTNTPTATPTPSPTPSPTPTVVICPSNSNSIGISPNPDPTLPQFPDVSVSPIYAPNFVNGCTLTVIMHIKSSPSAVTTASVIFGTSGGFTETVTATKIDGTTSDGHWKAVWIIKNYTNQLQFTMQATNAAGTSSQAIPLQ